jgi:hypothetical protein
MLFIIFAPHFIWVNITTTSFVGDRDILNATVWFHLTFDMLSKFCKFMFTMPIAQLIVFLLATWVNNLSCHIFTNLYSHDKCRKIDIRFILMFYLMNMANVHHLRSPRWNSFETKPTVGVVEELVLLSRIHRG